VNNITVSHIEDGYLSSASVSILPNQKEWYFNRLFVSPSVRKKGIATKLMSELVKKLDENKIDLFLDINPYGNLNYKQLENFYRQFGFEEYEGDYQFIRRYKNDS
jgi:GNAT superfamily N-acetyltransferase